MLYEYGKQTRDLGAFLSRGGGGGGTPTKNG